MRRRPGTLRGGLWGARCGLSAVTSREASSPGSPPAPAGSPVPLKSEEQAPGTRPDSPTAQTALQKYSCQMFRAEASMSSQNQSFYDGFSPENEILSVQAMEQNEIRPVHVAQEAPGGLSELLSFTLSAGVSASARLRGVAKGNAERAGRKPRTLRLPPRGRALPPVSGPCGSRHGVAPSLRYPDPASPATGSRPPSGIRTLRLPGAPGTNEGAQSSLPRSPGPPSQGP
ncbi:uncharacterized protein LOC144339581 isoform X1 [Macaca mulatta]